MTANLTLRSSWQIDYKTDKPKPIKGTVIDHADFAPSSAFGLFLFDDCLFNDRFQFL